MERSSLTPATLRLPRTCSTAAARIRRSCPPARLLPISVTEEQTAPAAPMAVAARAAAHPGVALRALADAAVPAADMLAAAAETQAVPEAADLKGYFLAAVAWATVTAGRITGSSATMPRPTGSAAAA